MSEKIYYSAEDIAKILAVQGFFRHFQGLSETLEIWFLHTMLWKS